MQLASHEAHELNELLMSCVNSINSMSLFIHQAQDPILRDMIMRHYAVHVQDYNMKVEFASKAQGSHDSLNVPPLNIPLDFLHPIGQYPPVQPHVKQNRLDDRSIATAYLLTLKRAGREYAWSTFECVTPQLRLFLEDAFRMCSHQAYEVWTYMARRGWYPVQAAPQPTMQAMEQIYREVPYHQPTAVYNR